MIGEVMEKVVFGRLTFEIYELGDFIDLVEYGVNVVLDNEPPFKTRYNARTKTSSTDIAKLILSDLVLASRDPESLWRRIEGGLKEMERFTKIPLPPHIWKDLRQGHARMVAWASERPEAIKEAFLLA